MIGAPVGQLHVFRDVVQRSDEWYDQRRGIVTASVVGKLLTNRLRTAIEFTCPSCGAAENAPCKSRSRPGQQNKTVHPERSAYAVAERGNAPRVVEPATGDEARGLVALLAAERITGHTDLTAVSFDMLRGEEQEPYAVAEYVKHVAPVQACGFMVRTWGACSLGCSPDGLVGDDGVIEVKSRIGKRHVMDVVAGVVPPEHMAQCQASLFVSGREWLDYVSYSPGMALWPVRVLPDPAWFDAIRGSVETFERDVEAIVAAYLAATWDLPVTERPAEDMVI
jgi:hypothetical protein